jgi:L-serine deaminase
MTIAQIVHDNEKYFGYTEEDIHSKVGTRQSFHILLHALIRGLTSLQIMRIWGVMDECIRTGVSTSDTTLPGRLGLRRRAPMLYRRLMRGCVPFHYLDIP